MEGIEINVGAVVNKGRLIYPKDRKKRHPAILSLHGWGSKDHLKVTREKAIIDLGYVYLTFDLRGHGSTKQFFSTSTRAEHIRDSISAYDFLAKQPLVDKKRIGVMGFSYGGYLGVLLTVLRPVAFLALRSPALYKHENFDTPKVLLHALHNLAAYRKKKNYR